MVREISRRIIACLESSHDAARLENIAGERDDSSGDSHFGVRPASNLSTFYFMKRKGSICEFDGSQF
jgi:hypothetical protein